MRKIAGGAIAGVALAALAVALTIALGDPDGNSMSWAYPALVGLASAAVAIKLLEGRLDR